jgi:hypothetical protein
MGENVPGYEFRVRQVCVSNFVEILHWNWNVAEANGDEETWIRAITVKSAKIVLQNVPAATIASVTAVRLVLRLF